MASGETRRTGTANMGELDLAIDENLQVLACEPTTPEVGDPTAVPNLLSQILTPFNAFIGDGEYDEEPVSTSVLNQQPEAKTVIPPQKNCRYFLSW
nr:hypothetical protein [uncultured Undibacterium sp.]